MARIIFGNQPVEADAYSDGAYRLSVVFSTTMQASEEAVPKEFDNEFADAFAAGQDELIWENSNINPVCTFSGFPLTLYTDNKGNYSLAVIKEISSSRSSLTYNYLGTKFSLATVGSKTAFQVKQTTGDTAVASTTTWRGMPLAVNGNGNMIMTVVTPATIDEEKYMYIGGMPAIVRRSGSNWYLVVATV